MSTLLPVQHAESGAGVHSGPPHGAMLAHAGSSLASQLVLHALGEVQLNELLSRRAAAAIWVVPACTQKCGADGCGGSQQHRAAVLLPASLGSPCCRVAKCACSCTGLSVRTLSCMPALSQLRSAHSPSLLLPPACPAGLQTTGAWLILSQGFAVAASVRLADKACDSYLTAVVRRLLHDRPGLLSRPWLLGAGTTSVDPSLLCKAYTLGMQVRCEWSGSCWLAEGWLRQGKVALVLLCWGL